MRRILGAFALLLLGLAPARAEAGGRPLCKPQIHEQAAYTVCTIDLRRYALKLFLDGHDGQPYGSLTKLAKSPAGADLVMAMNAGMYHPDLSPVGTAFYTLNKLGPSDPAFGPTPDGHPADMYSAGGGGWGGGCTANTCPGYNFVGWGRVWNATEVRISIGSGPVTKIPVNDGWFAFTWVTHNKYNIKDHPKLVAYNSTGKPVRTFP